MDTITQSEELPKLEIDDLVYSERHRRLQQRLVHLVQRLRPGAGGAREPVTLMPTSAILLIHCPDRKGIVAGVSGFLHRHGANILHADQHQDNGLGLFFMRVEWDLADFALDDAAFRAEFAPLAESFRDAVATGLLGRPARAWPSSSRSNALPGGPVVPPPHRRIALRDSADRQQPSRPPANWPHFYGIPFHHMPIERRQQGGRREGQLELLDEPQHRPGGAGALHADPVAGIRGAPPGADHQRASFLPAGLQRRAPVPRRPTTGASN